MIPFLPKSTLWKPIPNRPYWYAHPSGELKRLSWSGCRNQPTMPLFTKGAIGGRGYRYALRRSVHRIIAELFVPNPHNLPHVDHIDQDKTNNAASNLRWTTNARNIRTSKKAKINMPIARLIRHLYSTTTMTQQEIATFWNISARTVSSVVNNTRWNPNIS